MSVESDRLQQLRDVIQNKIMVTSPQILHSILLKCAEQGRIPLDVTMDVSRGYASINVLSPQQLYWMFEYSREFIDGLGSARQYFTEQEISDYQLGNNADETANNGYPVVFDGVTCLTPNSADKNAQFGFYLTVEQIAALRRREVLQAPLTQKDKHYVAGRTTRKRSITRAIEDGTHRYDSIRISLVDDGNANWIYDKENGRITINSGTMTTLEGNHPVVACEFVSLSNKHLEDMFHILFSLSDDKE